MAEAPNTPSQNKNISGKSGVAYLLLMLFLGFVGDFYIKRSSTGVIKLVLCLTIVLSPIVAVWNIIDLIKLIGGDMRDGDGKLVKL